MSLSTLLLSSAGVCCTKTEPTLRCNKNLGKTQTYSYMGGPLLCCFSLLDYETNIKYGLSFQCLTITTPLYSKTLEYSKTVAYPLSWKWPCVKEDTPPVTTTKFMNKYDLKFVESGKNPYWTTFLLVEWELHQTLQLCFYSLPFSLSLRITT